VGGALAPQWRDIHRPYRGAPRANARGQASFHGRMGGAESRARTASAGGRAKRLLRGSRAEVHASRATASVGGNSEARERGAWPRQARAPDITHRSALRDSGDRVKSRDAEWPRYVDWPLRRHPGHGPSLRGKRNGQLPGTAEKTAMPPKPPARRSTTARALTAVAKARGLPLHLASHVPERSECHQSPLFHGNVLTAARRDAALKNAGSTRAGLRLWHCVSRCRSSVSGIF
jgi:hypothetical protein